MHRVENTFVFFMICFTFSLSNHMRSFLIPMVSSVDPTKMVVKINDLCLLISAYKKKNLYKSETRDGSHHNLLNLHPRW